MATKRKRPVKLQCKPGYVQRGAACQKPKPKKNKPTSSRRRKTGMLGTLAATAVIGAGATAIAARKKGSPEEKTTPPPQIALPKKGLSNKQIATIGGVTAIAGASTVAATHPRVREALAQEAAFRQADVIGLVAKAKGLRETPEEKAASDKIRKEVREKYPSKTADGNYAVDTDSDTVIKDLDELFKKNRQELSTSNKNSRHREKLLQQQQLIRYTKAMHELSKTTHPGLVVAGFRDKDGNLVGATAGIPDKQYRALYFGGFLVAEGADRNAAKEFLKTNQEISKNMGFDGRLVGEPHESAKPLYKRYGGRPVPGDETSWIFDGKDRKKEEWYKKHESLREVADVIDVDEGTYGKEGNEGITQHIDDLALVPKELLGELKKRGLREIEIKNKPISQMNNLSHIEGQTPPGYPPGATVDTHCGGMYVFGEKTICLRGDLKSGSNSTALHEIGHAVAHLMKYDKDPRLKEVHKNIYDTLPPYQQQGMPGDNLGVHELFASSYVMWVKTPKVAKRMLHPELVAYFKEVVDADVEKLRKGQQRKDSIDTSVGAISVAKTTVFLLKNGNLIVPKPFMFDAKKEAGWVIGNGLVEIEKGSSEYKRWTALMK